MKNRNNRLFFALLFAAALMHAGALILIPDISRKPEEKPARLPIAVTLSFPPELPEPSPAPPPPAPNPPEPERPRPPVPLKEAEPVSAEPAMAESAAPEPALAPSLTEPAEIAGEGGGEGRPDTAPAEPSSPSAGAASGGPVFDPKVQEDLLLRYGAAIRLLIDKQKEYPYQARRQDQEGTVEIRFVLSRQGRLRGEPVLDKRSRYRLLNAAALEAVKKAVPYPPFPPEFPEEELTFSVTLAFSLTGNTF
jgi:protein TonB